MIPIVTPKQLLERRVAVRVEEDTVEGLARGYIVNTYELYKCNVQLEKIEEHQKQQEALINDGVE